MKLNLKEAALAAVVVAVLSSAALVLGWPYIDGEALFGKDKLVGAAQIVSALGTVAAVVVALWLASASERRADTDALNLAKVIAHRQILALHHLSHVVAAHCRNIDPDASVGDVRAEFVFIAVLPRQLKPFSTRFLRGIAPLGSTVTRDLGHAFSQIEQAANEASSVLEWAKAVPALEPEMSARRIMENSHGMCSLLLNHAHALLEVALRKIGEQLHTEPLSVDPAALKPLRKQSAPADPVSVNPSPPAAG